MQDVSGFGTVITLIASTTFPLGFNVTQLAGDTDPLELASIDIADGLVGINGDFITWAKAIPASMAIAVIPGSQADVNLQILWNANRVVFGRTIAADTIQATIVYPNGNITLKANGRLMAGPSGNSIASSGMQKTNVYLFKFEE